jgi:hypothetical protein
MKQKCEFFERRTDSDAGQTRSQRKCCVYFTIQPKLLRVAGLGNWAESIEVGRRQHYPRTQLAILLTMSTTALCSWDNQSTRCAAAN